MFDKSTFDYIPATCGEKQNMEHVRNAMKECAAVLEAVVPDGPDKTYLLRKFREVGMWANVAIMRHPDGSPRTAIP